MRHPRGKRLPQGRGQLLDTIPISQRPAEADQRTVPGHWEGDLLLGKRPSAVLTLVERTSRLVVLVALPAGWRAEQVRPALTAALHRLPERLRRSLTWNHGKEMAEHARFTTDTGIPVFFCDPRSPWQRASNENANGLVRQHLPRTADLRRFSQADLDRIAALVFVLALSLLLFLGDAILAFAAEQLRERRTHRLQLERERTKQARLGHDRDMLIWRELDNATSSEQAPEPR